jgi:hypothetical protein
MNEFDEDLPIRSIVFRVLQAYPNEVWKVKDIASEVLSIRPNTRPMTIRNTISTDFGRLELIEKVSRPGSSVSSGGFDYRLTQKGKELDPDKLPPFPLSSAVIAKRERLKKRLGKKIQADQTDQFDVESTGFKKIGIPDHHDTEKEPQPEPAKSAKPVMPEGVTSCNQVVKNDDGTFAKLEGDIDASALGGAIIDYITGLKVKIQKLADMISNLQEDHKKDVESYKLQIKQKNSELEDMKIILAKKHEENKVLKGKTFNLGEIVRFKDRTGEK